MVCKYKFTPKIHEGHIYQAYIMFMAYMPLQLLSLSSIFLLKFSYMDLCMFPMYGTSSTPLIGCFSNIALGSNIIETRKRTLLKILPDLSFKRIFHSNNLSLGTWIPHHLECSKFDMTLYVRINTSKNLSKKSSCTVPNMIKKTVAQMQQDRK